MEKIASRAGDAQIARRAMTAITKNYEDRKKYMEAYETWSQISSTWPGGEPTTCWPRIERRGSGGSRCRRIHHHGGAGSRLKMGLLFAKGRGIIHTKIRRQQVVKKLNGR